MSKLREPESLGERFADPPQDLMLRFGGAEDRRLDILVLKELIRGWVSAENIEGAHLQVTLLRPTTGRATVFGFDVRDTENVKPLLGVALQNAGLDPLMSGNAHFEVQAAFYGIKPDALRKVSDPLIERFMLNSYLDRAVGAYSGGTQRKMALALALCTSPPVTIFDEPTVGLDPHSRRQVWELIEEMRLQGKVVLFSTQYMDEAERLCDHIYVIDKGRIVAEGSPEELKALVGEGTLRIAVDAPAKLRAMVDGLLPGRAIEEDGEAVVVKIPVDSKAPAAILEALQSDGLAVREFSLSPSTLEDTFLHLTGHSLRPEPLGRSTADRRDTGTTLAPHPFTTPRDQ